MNKATLQLVLEAKDLATPALERLRAGAKSAGQEGGRAAMGLDGLNRAGKGLTPAAETMERLRGAMRDMAQELPDAATRASRAFEALRTRALAPGLQSMTALQQGARSLRQSLRQSLHTPPSAAGQPVAQRYNQGGMAFRRLNHPLITRGSGTQDDVPALLMRGEFVLRKDAVAKYGLDFLHALNGMRLPSVPFQAVPRLQSGGLVLPPEMLDMVPRFSMGGFAYLNPKKKYGWQDVFPGIPDGEKIVKGAAMDDGAINAFVNSKVQSLIGKLNLNQLRSAPQKYLSDVLGLTVDSVRVFAAGGSASGVDAEFQRKKNLINQDYRQRIARAKAEGNEEIAFLLEQQRMELEMLMEELRASIEDFADQYRRNMQKLLADYESTVSKLRQDHGKQIASLRSNRDSIPRYSFFNYERAFLSKRISQATNRYFVQEHRVTNRLKRNAKAETRTFQRLGDREERRNYMEGRRTKMQTRLDLRKTWMDYTHQIQELEMEWKKALQELEDKYGKVNITGFKHWLAKGGPVGFAAGGAVPHFPWASPHGDSVPAMLTPGEFVLRKDAARAIGRETLERLNSLGDSISRNLQPVLGFAAGGAVPGPGVLGNLPAGTPRPGMPSGDWGTLNIRIGDQAHQVLAEADVARALRKTLHKQARVAR